MIKLASVLFIAFLLIYIQRSSTKNIGKEDMNLLCLPSCLSASCLSVCLPVCLPFCLSVCLPVCPLLACPSAFLSAGFLPVCLPSCLSAFLPSSLPFPWSLSPSLSRGLCLPLPSRLSPCPDITVLNDWA